MVPHTCPSVYSFRSERVQERDPDCRWKADDESCMHLSNVNWCQSRAGSNSTVHREWEKHVPQRSKNKA